MTSSNILGQQPRLVTDPKGFMSSSLMFNFEGHTSNWRAHSGAPGKRKRASATVFGEKEKRLEQAKRTSKEFAE